MASITPIADPRVVAIPIEECGEPLVDLREESSLRVGERGDRSERWSHVRAGVAERLRLAQAACPEGVGLQVVEAYRPPSLQRRYFERDLRRVAARYPDWDEAAVRQFTSRYVAPPDVVPPHCTGGALDLTLVDDEGRRLDLGTPVNADPEEGDGACHTDATGLSGEASANRALLTRVMAGAGFANYPAEWWHWSYGDRYWAFVSGASNAVYGAAS